MVAQYQLPYYQGTIRPRERGFGALAQTVGRFAIPFLKNVLVPTALSVGSDFVSNAAPDIENVIRRRKSFKNMVKDASKQTIKKQLGAGRKNKRKKISKPRSTPKNSRARRSRDDFFKNFS